MTVPLIMQPAGAGALSTVTGSERYRAVIYDRDGVVDVLDGVVVESFGGAPLPAGKPAELAVDLTSMALAAHFVDDGRPRLLYPWVRIERKGVVHYRGYPSRWVVDPGGGKARLTLRPITDLAQRVTVSDPERINYLEQGDMEGALAYTTTGTVGVTATTARSSRGARSLHLTGGASGGTFTMQATLPVSTDGEDQHWWVTADVWTAEGTERPYLTVAAILSGATPTADDYTFHKLDEAKVDTTGEWVRYYVGRIVVPFPQSSAAFDCTFHLAADADCWVDELAVQRDDQVSVPTGGDPAQFVAYLWRRAWEKLDVPTTVRWTATGDTLTEPARARHAEYGEVAQLVGNWPEVESHYSAVRDRITCKARNGHRRRDLVLAPGTGVMGEAVFDEGDLYGVVISLGDDEGPDLTRRAGSFTNDAVDVPVELVDQAPAGTDPKGLDRRAQTLAESKATVPVAFTATLPAPVGGDSSADWLDRGLDVFDTFRARAVAGPVDVDAWVRVAGWEVRCTDGDTMVVELVTE